MREGGIRGLLRLSPADGEIVTLYVAPAWQGRGVGLLEFGVRRLEGMACLEIRLGVLNINRRARAFYERHGFQDIGVRVPVDEGRGILELRYRREQSTPRAVR